MKCLILLFAELTFFCLMQSTAQQLFTNTNIQTAYQKQTRSVNGKPGKNYWQNAANYHISVSFDPSTRLLKGNETIEYENNSPDTLKQLIIRLYPDLYKKGVERLSDIAGKDLNDGVQLESLRVGDENIDHIGTGYNSFHRGTLLYVNPKKYLMPHSKTSFEIGWHYYVNAGSPVRTGMVDSTSYFIAYFFPRLSVYDDVDGWDTWSYNGSQEFYNDFGNFNVEIKVPTKYAVWATGECSNYAENYSSQILQKIDAANQSEDIINVIDSTDYIQNKVFKNDPTGIWKFQAKNVTDFAFALSDHYLWDASSVVVDSATGRKTIASAAYNKIHKDYFDVASQAHETVYLTSHYYPNYPFPFPHVTVFDGTDQMEYPMMVNDNPTPTHKDAVQLTTHEIFHSYFPFMMGINETQYAWMDEGWATIGESVLSPKMGEPEDEGIFSKTRYERISGTDEYVPLITNTKEYSGDAYNANSYGKGGLCYYVLQDLLGDSLYFQCLHQYMNDWKGKHPTPYDFFYSFNSTSRLNLDWYWERWFFGWQYPDLSIERVASRDKNSFEITIVNKGGLPVPVHLDFVEKTSKSFVQKYTAAVWESGEKRKTFVVQKPLASIKKIILGNEFIPDKYKNNNYWKQN